MPKRKDPTDPQFPQQIPDPSGAGSVSLPTPSSVVNPYEYYQAFAAGTPEYTTESAYGDIGYRPTEEFLETVDEKTGLKYRDLIAQYDPYTEEQLRTQFRSGVKSGYESSVGELAGITGQARQMGAKAGFAGSGAVGRAVGEARQDIQGKYGGAFQGALLGLTSGIRSERMGYQDQLALLLQGFEGLDPADTILEEADRFGQTAPSVLKEQGQELEIALTTKTGTHRGFGMFEGYEYGNVIHIWDEAQGRYIPT